MADPLESFVDVLLMFEGAEGSTTFTNENATGPEIELGAGSPSVTLLDSKIGSGSLTIPAGTESYLVPVDPSETKVTNQDFCIDGWFNPLESGIRFCYQHGLNQPDGLMLAVSTVEARFRVGISDVTASFSAKTGWFHVAFVREGSARRIYVDGVLEASDTKLFVADDTSIVNIGTCPNCTGATFQFHGLIDAFRLTLGNPRYTSGFTPPTTAEEYALSTDTTPPTAPTVTPLTTEDTTPTVTGTFDSTDAAGGFTVEVDGSTYTLATDPELTNVVDAWSLAIPIANELALGTYSVTATATDGASNSASDATSNELVIQDVTGPTAPTVTPLTIDDTTPTVTGTFDSTDAAGGFTVLVDGVTYTLATDPELTNVVDAWSLVIPPANALALGTYSVTATATDGLSNSTSDTTSNELVIQDTTGPTVPTVASQTTTSLAPTISGTFDSSDAAGGFTVTVNGATYTLGVDAALTNIVDEWTLVIPALGILAVGTYDVTAVATDGSSNSSTDLTSGELVIEANEPPGTAPGSRRGTRERVTQLRALVYSVAGKEQPYDVYRFGRGRKRYERPNHNPFKT